MEKLRVGQLVNTHGIRGECKVKVITDFAEERFQVKQVLYLEKPNVKHPEVKVTVSSTRWHKDHLLVTFEEIKDMTSAEKYKGFDIFIDKNDVEELEDGYYAYELIGYRVVDENGRELGVIKQIEETKANDVIRIERVGLRDLLVPFVDAFVLEIDEDNQLMTIQWMEGLE